MKTKRKPYTKTHNSMGNGIRIREPGLYEVLDDVAVVWGLHNSICWTTQMRKGDVFNDLNMTGSWHDVVPRYERKDGVYFRRIGDCIPATELAERNAENAKVSPALHDIRVIMDIETSATTPKKAMDNLYSILTKAGIVVKFNHVFVEPRVVKPEMARPRKKNR